MQMAAAFFSFGRAIELVAILIPALHDFLRFSEVCRSGRVGVREIADKRSCDVLGFVSATQHLASLTSSILTSAVSNEGAFIARYRLLDFVLFYVGRGDSFGDRLCLVRHVEAIGFREIFDLRVELESQSFDRYRPRIRQGAWDVAKSFDGFDKFMVCRGDIGRRAFFLTSVDGVVVLVKAMEVEVAH